MRRDTPARTAGFLAVVVVGMAAIAGLATPGYVTDREMYEHIGRDLLVPDCSSLHCTRVLAAWVIEHLPGPSLPKWKVYALIGNLIGAIGVARLSRRFGASAAAARAAVVLSAFGAGAQLTLADPHTSDPFIYALGPWMALALFDGRLAIATVAATVGVLAKEFAAAPLWIFAFVAALDRRWGAAWRTAGAASVATAAWLAYLLWLILWHNYSFGGNPSARPLEGGYLATWIAELGALRAAGVLVVRLGPLLALSAAAYPGAPPPLRRLALGSLPAMAVLSYVQQPDRALWNFQFVLVPLVARLFDAAPRALVVVFMASYVVTNLPFDGRTAQLVIAAAFAVCAVALIGIIRSARAASAAPAPVGPPAAASPRSDPATWSAVAGAAAAACVLAGLLLVAADVAAHRRVESGAGVNVWAYRGPVAPHTEPGDRRVAVLGGGLVHGREYGTALPRELQELLNNGRLRGDAGYPQTGKVTVVNLAGPYDPVLSFAQTLRDYATLNFDVVCLYVGDGSPPPPAALRAAGWRRQSRVFRATGYLPILPSMWLTAPDLTAPRPVPPQMAAAPASWAEYTAALDAAIGDALERGAAVLVATHPFPDPDEWTRQDALAAHLASRFGGQPGFAHVDLRHIVDRHQPHTVEDLSQAVFRLLKTR